MPDMRPIRRTPERGRGVRLVLNSDGLGGVGFADERLPADGFAGPESRDHPDRILKADIGSLATAMGAHLADGLLADRPLGDKLHGEVGEDAEDALPPLAYAVVAVQGTSLHRQYPR